MNLEIDILSQKFPIFVSEMIDIEIEVFFSTYESKYSKSFNFTYVCNIIYVSFLWAGLRISTQFFPFSKRERLPQCRSSTVVQS